MNKSLTGLRTIGMAIMVAAGVSGRHPTAGAQTAAMLEACPVQSVIEAERVRTIADVDDIARTGDSEAFARDSRGRIFTWYYGSPGIVSVFGPDGSLAATLRGEDLAPGQAGMSGPMGVVSGIVVTEGDTVHVFDRSSRMRWTFSPSLELVRRSPLPGRPYWGSQVPVARDHWVIGADIPTETEVAWPLHLVGRDGHAETSFGTGLRVRRWDIPSLVQRVIAPGGEGRVWSAHVNRYRLELWDTGNVLHRVLERDASWFRPWATQPLVGPDEPRRPHVQDLAVDDAGNLWLLIVRPSESFRDFVEEYAEGQYTWTSESGYNGSVVEAIDPARGCVLASLETAAYLKRSLGDGHVRGLRASRRHAQPGHLAAAIGPLTGAPGMELRAPVFPNRAVWLV